MKKIIITIFTIVPLISFAQYLISPEIYDEGINNPSDLPWCDEKTEAIRCYDGISYSYLIDKNIALEDYPVTKTDFLLIKDSISICWRS